MRLESKKIFVTGASRGVGRAIALEAARLGADLIIHFNSSEEKAKTVVGEIEELGRKAVAVKGDWSVADEVLDASRAAWDAFGSVDILINNAGIGLNNHVFDFTREQFDLLFKTNVRGPFLASQTIGRKMVQAAVHGQIFTITSVYGLKPGTGMSLYSGTKAALEIIMKGMALELSPHKIRVNTLALGATETDMLRPVLDNPAYLEQVLAGTPLHRMAVPEEVAKLVCMLISENAGYMTGSTVVADGGMSLTKGYGPPMPYEPPQRS
jgi:NAD(P)-dependent dehydrogenase (short-subunit alcohol dehydrogenase family)